MTPPPPKNYLYLLPPRLRGSIETVQWKTHVHVFDAPSLWCSIFGQKMHRTHGWIRHTQDQDQQNSGCHGGKFPHIASRNRSIASLMTKLAYLSSLSEARVSDFWCSGLQWFLLCEAKMLLTKNAFVSSQFVDSKIPKSMTVQTGQNNCKFCTLCFVLFEEHMRKVFTLWCEQPMPHNVPEFRTISVYSTLFTVMSELCSSLSVWDVRSLGSQISLLEASTSTGKENTQWNIPAAHI